MFRLFSHRLANGKRGKALGKELTAMVAGNHPLVQAINNPMRRLIRNQLGYFLEAMPEGFDLRGASIGNLILAGGYLNNGEHLDPIIFLSSKLVGVRGTVRAVVNDNLHLGAELASGERIIGQHRLTGKEVSPIKSPIKELFLSAKSDEYVPTRTTIRKKVRKLIEGADLICYPPGSFYTSVVANLLADGVGSAIADNGCPKVYVPNLGMDPEQIGMSLDDTVITLLNYLKGSAHTGVRTDELLNFILIDSKQGHYLSSLSTGLMKELGIQVIDTRLISKESAPLYDAKLLVSALLSLT